MRGLLYPAPVRQKTPNPIRLSEISDPSAIADTGHVYTNDTATGTELMYLDDAGAEVQITANGALNGAAVSLTATQVPYGSAGGLMTSEAAFTYDATNNRLSVDKIYLADGATGAGNLALSFASDTDLGWFRSGANMIRQDGALHVQIGAFIGTNNGKISLGYYNDHIKMSSNLTLDWSSASNDASAATDLSLSRDAAAVLALKNGTTAQTIRIYGTTTGTKYLLLSHNGTDGLVDTAASAGQLTVGGTNATGVRVGKSGGAVGFYATTPVALQTGVAVSAAGIHAALVNLGLITA